MNVKHCALLSLLVACGEPASEAAPTADPTGHATEQAPAWKQFGFETWHDDFPWDVALSAPVDGQWYGRSRRQALEKVIDNLSGGCSHAAWKMAHGYFKRAPESVIPLLVEATDAALLRRDRDDMVENAVDALGALGRYRRPEVAQALMRAFEHPKSGIRNKAVRALVSAGTADSVRRLQAIFGSIERRAQSSWVEAVRRHLPYEELEPIFRDLLTKQMYGYLRTVAIREAQKLPIDQGLQLLGPLWDDATPELRLPIAVVLHRAADARGTFYLREVLQKGSATAKAEVLGLLPREGRAALIEDILPLVEDRNWMVRQGVIGVVHDLPGENVDNLLTVLGLDPHTNVRRAALRALAERGVRPLLDELIERVRTGSGSKLRAAAMDLMAAGDAQAIDALTERMRQTPVAEIRMFVQGLAFSQMAAAFVPLEELFVSPEQPMPETAGQTTVTYLGIVLPNLTPGHEAMLELFDKLDRADYRRRSTLVFALASAAKLTGTPEFRERAYALMRRIVFDRTEIPQMRLLALDLLRPDVRLDDAMRLKDFQEGETPAMRKALTSYLFEFF